MSTVATPPTLMPLEREFEQLFREHSHLLYRTAYSLLDSRADAEDALQTVFLRLVRNGLPQNARNNVKGYLYRSAVNASLDMIRSRKRQERNRETQRLECDVERLDESVGSAGDARHRHLTEALAELDPAAAQILVLKYVHCYKDTDIANIIGVSRGAIAMRLLRSRSRLKKLMRELSGEKNDAAQTKPS